MSDDAARRAVRTDLDRTIFLEAGAGSGKTSCLVDRFVALVETDIEADRIAAITFTEKAAGELVERIRDELERRSRDGRERCTAALAVLDRAAIGTLHAFAQRILNQHPVEAGLPPRIGVLDAIASQVAFEARWDEYVDRILDDSALAQPLRLLLASGAKLDHLHDVAVAFDGNWDLVAERSTWMPPPVPPLAVDGVLGKLQTVLALAVHCTDADDKLLLHLDGTVRDHARALADAIDDDARLRLLLKTVSYGYGRSDNWKSVGKDVVAAELKDIDADCEILRRTVQEGALQVLAASLAEFTAEGARRRQRAGELEFHDLLVLARRVLRDAAEGPRVRAALAERYQRLLLDEFQDIDPIQIELAVLIASDDPTASGAHWWEITPEPGRLFFVGDPKQSIYRFRRADIGMFLKARDELVGESEVLTRNFRTGRPIMEWVNHTFGELILEVPDSQPAYLPLEAERPAPDVGPPVVFVGIEHGPKTNATLLREAEARDVVAAICTAMTEQWSVGEKQDDGSETWRPPRWRDIAILLPARTSLPFLEAALEAAEVPYRAETSSIVYGTRAVRDLVMIARAVEDPTDALAVVAALRTPGFACGDDDLATWRLRHKGRWDHQGHLPDGAPVDHPVAAGLDWLGELHQERLWLSPSQVLERLIRDRRLMELAVEERRPRDLWRRMRFVLDQCRAWEEAGGVTLRQYLRWVEGQSAENSRVSETVLPETDDDAVRILTVHGAKGLEFPIVVLSGLTTEMKSFARGVEVRFPPSDAWAIKLKKGISTFDFDLTQPLDEQMDRHERIRLLYVAATRARDHLVVSTHRKQRKFVTPTAAEALLAAGGDSVHVTMLELLVTPTAPTATAAAAPAGPLPAPEDWQREHDATLLATSKSLATSATRLAADEAAKRAAADDPGLAKGAKDIDLPPWQRGRYGSAIGRAVHGVMQVVDLATGDGLDEAVKAQAAAEGVLGKEDIIEALCRSALASDIVQRAATRPHWREVYVGVPHDEFGVLEGYIDLLYKEDAGYVIVDYKTDAWSTPGELDTKVQRYAVQLDAYAAAIVISTREPVHDCRLLFCGPTVAVGRSVRTDATNAPD